MVGHDWLQFLPDLFDNFPSLCDDASARVTHNAGHLHAVPARPGDQTVSYLLGMTLTFSVVKTVFNLKEINKYYSIQGRF